MALWRFTPVAAADDPQWLDYPRWEEVVVDADSVGEALVTAARDLGGAAEPAGNETPTESNGLDNEKLYRVDRVEADAVADIVPAPGDRPAIVKAVRAEVEPVPPRTDILGS